MRTLLLACENNKNKKNLDHHMSPCGLAVGQTCFTVREATKMTMNVKSSEAMAAPQCYWITEVV